MLVSIVVPTLNRSRWVTACLDALDAQKTDAQFEIVIVDNGSTDNTVETLDAWCATHPRARWCREPDTGRSRALNAGLDEVRGELVLFTDDDAVADPGWIDAYVRWYLERTDPRSMAVGPILPVMTDLGPWPAWLPSTALWDVPRLDHGATRQLAPHEHGWGANLAIPTEVLAAVGGWDETIGNVGPARREDFEDTEFQQRVRASGGSIWFRDDAIVRHRVPSGRLTPRAIIRSAHARGLNDRKRVREGRRPVGSDAFIDGGPVTAGRALRTAVMWVVTAAMFCIAPGARRFERVRRVAWRCGWDRAAVATEWRGGRVITSLLARSRRLALRLIPTSGAP